MTWLVVSNTNSCHIYLFDQKEHTLSLMKVLNHPQSKLKGTDLVSDKPGHYKADYSGGGAFDPDVTPKELEIHSFAKEIANVLDSARTHNQYKELIIVAAPHMNGLIHNYLVSQVKLMIKYDLKKDYTHLSENELLEVLKKEMTPR
jgi:protein required for attachment to host cells